MISVFGGKKKRVLWLLLLELLWDAFILQVSRQMYELVRSVSIGLLQTSNEKLSTELDQHFLCCLTRHSQDGIVLSQLEI